MKKVFLTTIVVALFAMGFTASGDSEEVRYDDAGRKYHKVTEKCAKCDETYSYWEDENGRNFINKDDRYYKGKWYCMSHYPD